MPPDKTTTDSGTTEQSAEAGTPADKLYSQEGEDKSASDKTEDKSQGESKDESKKSEDKSSKDQSEDKSDDKSEDKKDESKDKDEDDKSEPFEIKVPEGVEADQAVLDEVKSLAEKAGLKSEQVQPLVDLHFKQLEAQAEAAAEASTKAWEKTIGDWKSAIEKDPELGGDKAEAVQSTLGKALDQFGSAEAREAFDLTGAGWNPHVVRFIHNMAKALNEGTAVNPGNPGVRRPATAADALYGQPT